MPLFACDKFNSATDNAATAAFVAARLAASAAATVLLFTLFLILLLTFTFRTPIPPPPPPPPPILSLIPFLWYWWWWPFDCAVTVVLCAGDERCDDFVDFGDELLLVIIPFLRGGCEWFVVLFIIGGGVVDCGVVVDERPTSRLWSGMRIK